MSITFRECSSTSLQSIRVAAPDGVVIGVIGEQDSGAHALLRLACSAEAPASGTVTASDPRRYHGPLDPLVIETARTLALFHTLDLQDAVARAHAAMELEMFRRSGGTALLVSHDLELIQWLADEVWWLHRGQLVAKGDPRETIDAYRRHIAQRLTEAAQGANLPLTPTMRKGDGRASLDAVELLDAAGNLTSVWRSGEMAAVRIRVRFAADVADPVVGILIRTRIGFEVFGTNTELEKVKLGPVRAGETLEILFRFTCHLCPQEYTLTVASHDPDGVWHDWMEDGIAFSVADHRYTAGVACLRANVEVKRF
ncbi:MAG: Wzt carbohydrate-binding domain-containing protein [Bryobacterales bacterium]|nr:Wzt carbohydrate-binding domain-containing protein [Bryobacterales bacterium]